MKNLPHYERDELYIAEIYEAIVTGALPVFFAEKTDSYLWGGGTLFMVQWGEHQFAITAKHVIENQQADWRHLRILIPGYNVALPLTTATVPNHPNHDCKDDVEDIFVFHIEKEPDLDGEELAWYTWRMKEFWMPASNLAVGQQIFAVGYPFIDERYDYDANKVKIPPLVVIGKLSPSSIGNDIFTIDCEEFEMDLNGISGGPVFARCSGFFHYVGMIIRAGQKSKKIHFVDASYVTFIFNEIESKL
jgi:hypothetical protein